MTVATYFVWCPDRGQDFYLNRAFGAHSASDAAIQWARDEDNSGEPGRPIADSGDTLTLRVRDTGGVETYFDVTGEVIVTYRARNAGVYPR